MNIYNQIINKEKKLSVIGLGYVGLPLAIAFSKVIDVIGFDINERKIDLYKNGIDVTGEVGEQELKDTKIQFTSDERELKRCSVHIIAVPTPINLDKTPNLKPVIEASEIVGKNLSKGSIVVYESTVYPGVTEDICVPILEKHSGLILGEDFKVGYSPERINPGDKIHRLETIIKIVSGTDKESLDSIAALYGLIIKAGIYKAESIKVAEAAKVIENAQRDINIAFMNELSIIFNQLGIDTKSVLKAAETKWNFLSFTPGLVGGHCIGVDPYYLTYKAEEIGYHSQVIIAGRRINDIMGKYVAENTVKSLIRANKQIKGAKVGILGITFKENCPDVRNTRVIDVIRELDEYGVITKVTDPIADSQEVWEEYGVKLYPLDEIRDMDAVIITVSHNEYSNMKLEEVKELLGENEIVLIDVKGIFDRQKAQDMGFVYWRL